MKFENIHVYNFEGALRGMRNPKNSWHLSDSVFGVFSSEQMKLKTNELLMRDGENSSIYAKPVGNELYELTYIGPKDMKLAQALIRSGPEHRKFLRQIFVSVDITAPLYWY